MENSTIILSVSIAVIIAVFVGYIMWVQRKNAETEAELKNKQEARHLQLQAYERLSLLAERTKLENMINREYRPMFSSREMQMAIINGIRDEYDHNVTQRLYVAPEIWAAVSKMREQNAYIVNQLASMIPPHATALDLNKRILDYSLNNPNGTMNNMVLEAIDYEAKKLL